MERVFVVKAIFITVKKKEKEKVILMTVGELKKRLEGYPDDMPVVVPHSSVIVEKDIMNKL